MYDSYTRTHQSYLQARREGAAGADGEKAMGAVALTSAGASHSCLLDPGGSCGEGGPGF